MKKMKERLYYNFSSFWWKFSTEMSTQLV